MKRGFFLFLLIAVFGSSVAFSAAPDIGGIWSGSFIAIYNNGDVVVLIDGGTAEIFQNEEYPNLFYGTMTFTMPDGEGGTISFVRYLTGYIGEDKRISIQLTAYESEGPLSPPINAIGIVEGHLTGKTIKGVVRDFTDTTTTMFVATKQ